MAIYPLDIVICSLYNWVQIFKLDTFLFTFIRVAKCDLWMIKPKNDVSTTIIWNGYCFLQQLNITGDICIFKYDKAQIFDYLFMLCQVVSIAELLNTLPMYSSAVITSADSLITELFTHNGMPL